MQIPQKDPSAPVLESSRIQFCISSRIQRIPAIVTAVRSHLCGVAGDGIRLGSHVLRQSCSLYILPLNTLAASII